MKNIIGIISLCLFSLVVHSQTALEQPALMNKNSTENADLPDVFYTATAINRFPPDYPDDELRKANEGWVLLSYVISTEGNVVDPIILDSSGSTGFEKAAISALQQYTFTPARLNGENVEQCSNYFKMVFMMDGKPGVPRRFSYNYKQFVQSLNGGEVEKAGQFLKNMEEMPQKNLYQDAWLWWAKSLFANHLKDDDAKFYSLRKAIAYEGKYLPDEIYVVALTELFVARMSRFQIALAMQELEKLRNTEGSQKYLAQLADYIQTVEQAVDSNQPLLIKAGLKSDSSWKHSLYRKSFMIDKITGILNKYELRCDKKRITGEITAGQRVSIPDNWGECMVILHGTNDTSFEFYEI